jgi:hypothetical protein
MAAKPRARPKGPWTPEEVEDLSQGGNFCLATDLGRLDVFQWVSGVEANDLYAELDANWQRVVNKELPVSIAPLP